MAHEEWRDVVGYEGCYQASNLGRIRSVDKITNGPYGSKVFRKGRIRKLGENTKTGYLCVVLSSNGVHQTRDVHRIIAETFIPNPENLPCVDHINCNRHDNRVENLRWVTQKENIKHSIENGNFGLDWRTEILKRKDVRENNLFAIRKPIIRSDGMKFKSVSDAARVTGCSNRAIHFVLSGEHKTCRGYTFKYA